jgi:hypothetical protein
MGRPSYWKKNRNDLDNTVSGIQKLTHFVQGSPSNGFVNFLRRKSKLFFAPKHGLSASGKPLPGEVLEGDIGIASPTLSGRLRSLLEKGPSLPA